MVPATGTFVLMYHLLWELTHVCFEHPGLLKPPADECTDDVCVTCSDEGRLGEVVLEPARNAMRPVRRWCERPTARNGWTPPFSATSVPTIWFWCMPERRSHVWRSTR